MTCVLAEWHESMFGAQDARVRLTKLAWWGRDLAQGVAAQHPLGRIVARAGAERGLDAARWTAAVDAASVLAIHDDVDSDAAAGCARWRPLAEAVAAIEQGLLGQPVDAETVSAQWRTETLLSQLHAANAPLLPMNLRARFGAIERWREGLPDGWRALHAEWGQPERSRGGMLRHLRHRLQRDFWRRLCAGRQPEQAVALRPVGLLWHSWQAARAGRAE